VYLGGIFTSFILFPEYDLDWKSISIVLYFRSYYQINDKLRQSINQPLLYNDKKSFDLLYLTLWNFVFTPRCYESFSFHSNHSFVYPKFVFQNQVFLNNASLIFKWAHLYKPADWRPFLNDFYAEQQKRNQLLFQRLNKNKLKNI